MKYDRVLLLHKHVGLRLKPQITHKSIECREMATVTTSSSHSLRASSCLALGGYLYGKIIMTLAMRLHVLRMYATIDIGFQ